MVMDEKSEKAKLDPLAVAVPATAPLRPVIVPLPPRMARLPPPPSTEPEIAPPCCICSVPPPAKVTAPLRVPKSDSVEPPVIVSGPLTPEL